ncbi:MAG: thermonuclease family protein [Gaiellales bacterium]
MKRDGQTRWSRRNGPRPHPARAGLLLLFLLVLSGCAQDAGPGEAPGNASGRAGSGVVARVGDGDTIELEGDDRVRLVQIDAPELGEGECYAERALRELETLTPAGSHVELEADPELDDVDRYGRLLRYVIADGAKVNVELVRRGAAAPYFHDGVRGRYADDLLAAVVEARAARRGMWGACAVDWEPDRQVDTLDR